MHPYHKILLLLKALLYDPHLPHWEKQIDFDISDWELKSDAKGFKSHFGGMGSIDDITVAPLQGLGYWSNSLFDILKDMGYEFADKKTISFYESHPDEINGAICGTCSYAEIGEPELEYFLSRTFLPAFIKSILPTENYLYLLDIEQLSHEKQVNELRSKITIAVQNKGIAFKSEIELFQKGCPKCMQRDISAYSWVVMSTDSTIQLKKRPSWWQKLLFR